MELFNGLKQGARLTVGKRTIVATGKPKCIGACPTPRRRGLGKLEWDAPLRSATIIVGQDKGAQPRNTAGRCAAMPAKFSVTAVDRWFSKIRGEQVGRAGVAASRIAGAGWYKGKQERSVSYQVIHDPSVSGEENVGAFRRRMQQLAEDLAEHFCQDEVLVVMDTEKGKHTFSYSADAPKKRAAKKRRGA